jgi:16S rRNA (cytosine1402-N4)-methyltransferase
LIQEKWKEILTSKFNRREKRGKMQKKHIPVLLQEVLETLEPKSNQNFIDATLGLGGHAKAILEKTGPKGILIGIDQDLEAQKEALTNLNEFKNRVFIHHLRFDEVDQIELPKIDGGILADLGVSSIQLDQAERGFSFRQEGPLDMRMNKEQALSAESIVNDYSEAELAEILWVYGEERFSRRIARAIVEKRKEHRITTTKDLSEIAGGAIPRKFWPKEINPATRTFQAIRIAVNDELGALERFLPKTVELTEVGAKIAIITFHSLEDRIVKEFFAREAKGCTCPPEFPKCICGKTPKLKILTRKGITATEAEIKLNPRSRSAKLRVAERIS